jgi:hypothetical protein
MSNPHEFPTITDIELWETLLWCSTDGDNPLDDNYTVHDADIADGNELNDQYWQWRDSASEIMVSHGFGDKCLEDLLGDKAAHLYILTREGHGVSMTDNWLSDSPEYACCKALNNAAIKQGAIGPYVGDDSKIYLCWSE